MKVEFVAYLEGGKYAKADGTEVSTTLVSTSHYAFLADKNDCGNFFLLYAAVCTRFRCVKDAESILGNFVFKEVVKLGDGNASIMQEYGSVLPMLSWWEQRLYHFLDWEKSLLAGSPVSVFVNVPHGNELVASMHWLVNSANCQPTGLSYELEELDKGHSEDSEDDDQGEMRATESDVRAIKSMEALQKGVLKLKDILGTFNVGGATVVEDAPIEIADGFLDSHKALLDEFKDYLKPFVVDFPYLQSEVLDLSYSDLGSKLSNFFNDLMRCSFPDVFAARLAQEEVKAAKIRKEMEAKKKREG